MLPLTAVRMPARLAGWALHGGPRALVPRQSNELGQVGVVEPAERANLIKITTGIAMSAGGTYALLNIPNATRVSKVALGILGGGLLLTGLLQIYDGVA